MKNHLPDNDPGQLLRYRDSIYASDLLVCAVAYLDFFTYLNNAPKTFDEIYRDLKIESRPADVMVSLFLSMNLIERAGDTYRLTDLSSQYLVSDNPASLVPYYCSLENRPQCMEFNKILKTGKPAAWSSKKEGKDWIERMQDREFADSFTAAMDSRGNFLAEKLAEKFDLSKHTALLDIGGGSGIYACSIVKLNNHLDASVLEISPVDIAAKRSIESKSMASRVDVIAADMFKELPAGFDVHMYANAFHDWDVDSVKKLAVNSFNSLPSGGLIAVFDAHLNEFKNGPLSIAEYSCLLMHSTEGKCYSTREISSILISTGFRDIEVKDVAADRTLVTGRKI